MTIIPTPDIEMALAEEARKRGTTPELLALDYLRAILLPSEPPSESPPAHGSLADYLGDHLGVLSSSELVPGGARMSEDTGKKFAEGLLKKRERGRL